MRHTLNSFMAPAAVIAVSAIVAACGGTGSSSPSLTAQTISFSAPSTAVLVGQTVTLSGSATSSLPLSYTSSTASVCTINSAGTGVTGVSAGSCTITANQAGNSTYAAATAVPVTFNIALDPQTISFSAPTAPAVGGTANLTATASSGLAVTFASSTTSVCTVSGSTLTAVAAGTCTVTASQTGNSTYAAAASVPQSFNIASAAPTVAVFSTGFASASATVQGGGYGGYSGSNIDGWNCGAPASCGSGGGYVSSTITPAQSYYYYYYQTPTPATGQYMGIFIQAPGVTALSTTTNTSGLQLTNQTTMTFTLNQNPEWAGQANHNIAILLTLGKYYSVGGNACNIKLQAVMTPTGGSTSTTYTIPLSSFVVSQNCGIGSLTPSSVTTALTAAVGGPVAQIDFQGDGGSGVALTTGSLTSSANSTVANGGVYPTTIAFNGGITFQ